MWNLAFARVYLSVMATSDVYLQVKFLILELKCVNDMQHDTHMVGMTRLRLHVSFLHTYLTY